MSSTVPAGRQRGRALGIAACPAPLCRTGRWRPRQPPDPRPAHPRRIPLTPPPRATARAAETDPRGGARHRHHGQRHPLDRSSPSRSPLKASPSRPSARGSTRRATTGQRGPADAGRRRPARRRRRTTRAQATANLGFRTTGRCGWRGACPGEGVARLSSDAQLDGRRREWCPRMPSESSAPMAPKSSGPSPRAGARTGGSPARWPRPRRRRT